MIYIWKGLGGVWHIGDGSDYAAWMVFKLALLAIALTIAVLALIIVVPYSLVSGVLSRVVPRPIAMTGGAAASVGALILANVLLAPHPMASYQFPGAVVVSATAAPAAAPYTAAPARPGAPPAPTQVSPANGTTFDVYPRTTTLTWRPVAGAKGYWVEIQYWVPSQRAWVTLITKYLVSTSYRFDFVGAQPGAWSVAALGANGVPGTYSPWWHFTYVR